MLQLGTLPKSDAAGVGRNDDTVVVLEKLMMMMTIPCTSQQELILDGHFATKKEILLLIW